MGSIPFRFTATYGRNTNINKNINGDQEYYYKKFPYRNVLQLKTNMNMLQARKRDLEKHTNPDERTEEMKTWMEEVEDCHTEINTLLKYCPRGARRKTNFGVDVDAHIERVKCLDERFKKWEHVIPNVDVVRPKKPYCSPSEIFGLESKLAAMLEHIKQREFPVIGIFGSCGIGKTTLLKEFERVIRNNGGDEGAGYWFKKLWCSWSWQDPPPSFTVVISVSVTREPDLKRIQEKIASKLKRMDAGMQDFNEFDVHRRAETLSQALSRETFLIMLDDLWNKDHLDSIGIPLPPQQLKPGSTIVITTRLKSVCASTLITKRVEMEFLNELHSLKLFTHARGGEPIKNDDEETADKIVEKCAGLPLALITLGVGSVGRHLSLVCEHLSKDPKRIDGMEDVLLKLKHSFDELKDDDVKGCLLFCVLFQDTEEIDVNRLVDYWIGEYLVKDDGGLAGLRLKGKDIVQRLLGCCLLEEAPDVAHVKMHSIVRIMAVWLAKEGPDAKYRFEFCAGEEFNQKAFEKMKRASFVDTDADINKVLQCIPTCPFVKTLLMGLSDSQLETQRKNPISIRSNCFPKGKKRYIPWPEPEPTTPCIGVLDLAGQPIENLPTTIGYLKSLRYLNLSCTSIKRLPAELGEVASLIQLDLTSTKSLHSIPAKAISGLVNLGSLKLCDSAYTKIDKKDELSLKDLMSLTLLAELQFTLQKLETLESLSDYTRLLNLTTYLQLFNIIFQNVNQMFEILLKFKYLEILSIRSCEFTEEEMSRLSLTLSESKDEEIEIDLGYFPKLKTLFVRDQIYLWKLSIISPPDNTSSNMLRKLHISYCSNLTSITYLCQLQKLEILEIENCEKIDQLLPLQTAASNHQKHISCLVNLRSLKLRFLPQLKEIFHCNLSFNLVTITVSNCNNLKKLQVNPINEQRKIIIHCEEAWWKALEWKNGVIDTSFFPSYF